MKPNPIKINRPERLPGEEIAISPEELVEMTRNGKIKWIMIPPTSVVLKTSYRAAYQGRLYIMESNQKFNCYNMRNDGLIWWSRGLIALFSIIMSHKV